MYLSARPWRGMLATGLLLAGVVSAVNPTPAAPPVTAPAIELAALPSWLRWVNDGTDALTAQIAAIAAGVQNEIEDPVPIIATIVGNQIINAQDLGSALVTSTQVVLTALARIPDLLLNAAFDVIANPLSLPGVLTRLLGTVVNTANAAITPVRAALTSLLNTTTARIIGVTKALAGNVGAIGTALANVPVAIGTAIVNAAVAVAGSVFSLNPFNVIGAAGEGLVEIEVATFNAAGRVGRAVGNLRSAVRAAVAYPLPAASVPAPARPSASRVTAPTTTVRAASRGHLPKPAVASKRVSRR